MSNENLKKKVVLGLDVGSSSLGWVLMNEEEVLDIGSRIFEAGMDGNIEKGTDESYNVQRRDARLTRRRLQRRTRRLIKLALYLQRVDLLPESNIEDSKIRHEFFNTLDRSLSEKYNMPHALPYLLRAKALDEKLTQHELGRVLYHICQRRGFLSNRKSPIKDKEEHGKVKDGIKSLREKLSENDSKTLGEYFSKFDPDDRIRTQYTARDMYDDEFNLIWDKQAEFYPDILTDDFKDKIYHVIFDQRPIKFKKSTIGMCELEKTKRRAPALLLDAQRFRLIHMINGTKIYVDNVERELTDEERETLINKLETEGDLAFTKAKKLLGLKMKKDKFNWEGGPEKRFIGNRTSAALIEIFGEEKWNLLSKVMKDQVVEDIHSIQKNETLLKRGLNKWELSEEKAIELSEIALEPEYLKLSRAAIAKLLPRMEKGEHYSTLVKEFYGDTKDVEEHDILPPLFQVEKYISNPAVIRSLTELRKVVNTVIREHGKPDEIHIEFARELKQGKKSRQAVTKRISENEQSRSKAAKRIIDELKIQNPTRTDILKVQLAEECNWECPYTGRTFSIGDLFKPTPQFDIEHIIPFSRCLDNSYLNKTLCWSEENKNVKRNMTPFEAYSNTDKWDEIIQRVKRFKGDVARFKLARFMMDSKGVKEKFEDFSARQLNDTSYVAKLSQQYLRLLYGNEWRKHIVPTSGGVTSFLRNVWGLNSILQDGGPKKERTDHRHHAVDAVVIAMTNRRTLQMLAYANSRRIKPERLFNDKEIKPPWETFWDDVKEAIDGIVVSHRVSNKVSGQLHEETFYGLGPDEDGDGKPDYYTITRPLTALKKTEVDKIVDPYIRQLVKDKLGDDDPKNVFQEKENRPFIIKPDDTVVFVNKVKVKVRVTPFQLVEGEDSRYVTPKSNHHAEVIEYTDKKGRTKWDFVVVSMLEACLRKKDKLPVINRDYGEGKKFLFSLAPGDIIELDNDKGGRSLYRIRTVPMSKQLSYVSINNAMKQKDAKEAKRWYSKKPDKLREANCQKVTVNVIGRVRRAND